MRGAIIGARWAKYAIRSAACERSPAVRLLILFYNHPRGEPPPPDGCIGDCVFTAARERLFEADAVVFHVPTLPAGTLPAKRPGQVWVASSMESEVYYPALRDPRYMAAFDLTMTYRRDADVWSPYFGPGMADELTQPPMPKTEAAPAVYFCRNHRDRAGRAEYVAELMTHLAVDSYGASLQTRRLPGPDLGRRTKVATIARYRFTLAFENSIAHDYVTEKFFDPLIVGSVPVYLGAPNIDDYAPGRDCFVRVSDFSGPAALARHLLALAADEAAYARLLAWKRQPLRPEFQALLDRLHVPTHERLCALLHERAEMVSF
jgi:hypothetical protein